MNFTHTAETKESENTIPKCNIMRKWGRNMYTPPIPKFDRSKGKDGKMRLYLIASNRADIELMMNLCGCFQEGTTHQKDKHSELWYRIIKKHEEKLVSQIFDIG